MRREQQKKLSTLELRAMGLTPDLVVRRIRGPGRTPPDARNFLSTASLIKVKLAKEPGGAEARRIEDLRHLADTEEGEGA